MITNVCKQAIQQKINSIDNTILGNITQNLKTQFPNSEWFIFVSKVSDDNYEFIFSGFKDTDILTFKYDEFYIYVAQL